MRHLRWLAVVVFAGCMQRETRDDETKAERDQHESFNDQALKGAGLYTANCAKCHGVLGEGTKKAPRVVDMDKGALSLNPPAEAKKRTMQFVTVADVAKFVVANMPADDAGKLSEDDYFRILAFDLKANGAKVGNEHLDMARAANLVIPREGDQLKGEERPSTSMR
ncbi:MAG: cytochrome c [Archangiaceae bacterium]|nr:cytochrome c [Archangiaceae bacterium]